MAPIATALITGGIFILGMIIGTIMDKKYCSEYCWIPYIIGILAFVIGLADGDLKEAGLILLLTIGGLFLLVLLLFVLVSAQGRCK